MAFTKKPKPATLIWTIDNFLNLNSSTTSRTFSLPNDENYKFNLYLNPKCQNEFLCECTSIFLQLVRSYGRPMFHLSLWIVNSNGDKCAKQEATIHYDDANGHKMSGQGNFRNAYLRNQTNGLLVDGKLTIHCEVTRIEDNEFDKTLRIALNQEKPSKITEDFATLLESEKFADVVLLVGEKEYRLHKNILSSRSPVFAAMFEHDCEEKRQNRVEIIDLDVEVCDLLVRYLYTGNVSSLDRFFAELLAAADKYQLDELKCICEHYLCKLSLDINSVAILLHLSDMHNAEQLKSKCIEYIGGNFKAIRDTDSWKKLFVARPELGFQLFINVVNKK